MCDTALLVGEDEPTLCGEWTVKDLVVHLILRESSPASLGLVVSALSGALDAASRRLAARDFSGRGSGGHASLVERLRGGPPRYSPFAIPRVDALLNGLEFFVHHEDIRRAQPAWAPRELSDRAQQQVWKGVCAAAPRLLRRAPVGVQLECDDLHTRATVHAAETSVLVVGAPAEVTMFVFGRKAHADVELRGPDDAVAALRNTDLGV